MDVLASCLSSSPRLHSILKPLCQVLKHGQAVRRVAEEELVVLGDAALPCDGGRFPSLGSYIRYTHIRVRIYLFSI